MANGLTNEKCGNVVSVFKPTEKQKSHSHVSNLDEYWRLYKKSLEDPDAFWSEAAAPFYWKTPVPEKNICNYNINVKKGNIFNEWMKGTTTNICYNALDRNVKNGHGDKIAYYWVGNDPQDSDKITYRELLSKVCRFANVLKIKGVKKGDMVTMYLPMIPELVVAMFACARIGAIHSVVYGGYSSESLAKRLLNGNIKVLVSADGVYRGTKFIQLKNIADRAVEICKEQSLHLTAVILVGHQMNLSSKRALNQTNDSQQRTVNMNNTSDISLSSGNHFWWHEEMENVSDVCEPVWVDAEHTLFTLYTSGSTGKPKGAVHTTGGYMIYTALSFKYVFDYFPGDVFFCTADIGWITGHTYNVYGSLLNAATCILFEGSPTYPDAGRYWEIIEKYDVSIFYTAPTAIRSLMSYDDVYVTKFDRSSLRVLACAGEPINYDAWMWYYRVVGEERCPIVDTYWQTETGGPLLTPLPFCTPLIPGCAALPFFGIEPAIVDDDGNEIIGPGEGNLVIKRPWPSLMRTVYGDHTRFEDTYFAQFPGYYCTGDGGKRDENGLYWVTGRIDDMLNVCGRLLSTAEVEAALMGHKGVVESAVVAQPHSVKGECLYCFVVLKSEYKFDEHIVKELSLKVEQKIGSFARPDFFHHAPALPKTRSGKTVRRILRKIAANDRDFGDLSTLFEEAAVNDLLISKKYLNSKVPILVENE